MWSPDEFLEHLHGEPVHAFKAETQHEWKEWRPALKAALIEALVLPSGEEAGTLQPPVVLSRTDCGDYVREHLLFQTAPHLQMPAYLLVPKQGQAPYPAIVVCPGHGYGYKQLVGLLPDGTPRPGEPGIYKDFPLELVKRGCIVIVFEMLGLGDRRLQQDWDKEPNENSCFRLASNLLMAGKTLAGYRVHEMMRCVDYLQSREDVAPDRIGCMGFSGGGNVSALTAAVDERICAAVISGYTNTFLGSILAKPHCSDNYIPSLMRLADMPDIWGLIAPRPLLIETGEADKGFPLPSALEAIAHLRRIYAAAGVADLLAQEIHPGQHEVSGRVAYDWLVAQLTAGGN